MNSVPFRFTASCKTKTAVFTLIFAAGLFSVTFGQIKAAKNEMAQYNYTKAIEILHQFIQNADPNTKSEATLLMADCYRLENDMQDAKAWYFKAIRLGNTDPLTYFYYAKALRACGDYEAAKKIFLRYDSLMPDDHRGKIYASFCDSAIAWDEKPFAFEVNNARSLNSTSSEFGPVFYKDGVIFATDRIMSTEEDRKAGLAGNGLLKLVFSNPKQKDDYYGEYNLPKVVPEFYSNGSNDGPATFSKDGEEVFITRTYKSTNKSTDATEDGESTLMKIFTATKTAGKWSKMKPFFFNSNDYSVGYPALSPDGNSLYFVSNVEGGYGGTDIYVTMRSGGDWSTPQNLGPVVNTFGNQTLPFIANNGDLYFSSDGHPGYGGLDIFVTRKVGNEWMTPQNLGKPINSSYDDFALAMYQNDSVGIFSANRPGGRGEDDLYTFRVVVPLPALTSQPAIAAVTHNPPETSGNPAGNPAQKPATPPASSNVKPATGNEGTSSGSKQTVKEPEPGAQRNFPVKSQVTTYEQGKSPTVSGPATTESKAPSKEQQTNPTTNGQTGNVVTAQGGATAETKQKVKEPEPVAQRNFPVKSQVTTYEQGKAPSVSGPATAETKTQAKEQNAAQSTTRPANNVVPATGGATAETKQKVKEPEPGAQRNFPVKSQVTTYEQGKAPTVSGPATAESKAPSKEQQTTPTTTGQAGNVVPARGGATAETKLTVKEPEPGAQRNFHVNSQGTTYQEGKAVTTSGPATVESKTQTSGQGKAVAQQNPAATKEELKAAENAVPAQSLASEEIKPTYPETPPVEKQTSAGAASAGNTAGILVTGCIKDGVSKDPIPLATLFFLDESKGYVIIHKSGANGCFRSRLNTGDNYQVKAMQTGYSSACMQFNSDALGHQAEVSLPGDLLLEKVGILRTTLLDNIYYDFDRYFIRPDAEPALNKIVKIMNDSPVTLEMGSHADCRGSQEYNLKLTEKRATSALQYLLQKGINKTRIISKWYGKSQLVNYCDCSAGINCTDAEHQLNRRTEFKIFQPGGKMTELPINLDKFAEGDTIQAIYLPEDFFKNCNQHMLSGPLADFLNASSTLAQLQGNGVKYTVQIGAFSYVKPNFTDVNGVMSCKGSDGILRCFVGQFSSLEEANWYRDHLRSGEFKDAFVSVMDEKHNPSTTEPEIYLSKR